ncbi:TPA: hypothetical protein PXS19_004007 [Yersinia enterocolitica]|nr:hypothetical protein [Yersinia enterocolitica]HDL8531910.1 hypothetical protein [Yersinia enterocolitica]HDL8551904.1 hypothetical protein [Yersinia enterocolitica]HDL8562004.1 hypothetical protein [Yersinia enterocolitica]
MSYHPERQRPEQQVRNANREALNIQQPGEHTHQGFDWEAVKAARKAAGRPLTVSQTTDPSINLKDMALSAVAVPADMVSAGAQWFKAGNQLLDSKAEEYSSGEKKPLIDIPVDPELLRVMRENGGNQVSRTGSALIEKAGALAEHFSHDVKANYSEGAKQAAAMKFAERDAQGNLKIGAGAFDKDAWLINAIPTLTQLATGGYAAKLGAKAVAQGIERSVYERLKKSVPDTVARETAQMAAEKARAIARKSGFVGITAGTAQGQGGMEMRDEINALPFAQLIESPTFQRLFEVIDKAPENGTLSDTQKLTLARQQLAEVAASSVTADPRLLAINIAASTLGDHTLLKLLTGKTTARGIVPGMVRGTLAEGATEYAQGASQRYAQNQQLIDTAGQKIDPMKDVVETGANNAMLGAGIGGTIGAVGGVRGRHAASDVTPETPPEVAGTPIAEESPPQSPIMTDPQVNDPAMADAVAQPRSVEEHGIPNHRIDDFRDTPAYRRQDPRVQGFTDDSEVQRALAEPSSPTAQALIEQQMVSGEQGLSPDELARRQQAEHVRTQRTPRLPEPGNIHPGEGFPMSGPVLEDEAQVGSQPQFTAGEQIRGPVFLPKDTRAEQQGAVREVHTYDGETDPRAITDKNIIFSHGPGVNSDDVQSGQAPQFEGGLRKDVRRFTEAMAGSSKTVITDQRQRAGGVPIDARTEAYAYAKGEVPGELRLFAGKPFSSEKAAKYSKWGKIPGSTIEPVGQGYGVRLPTTESAHHIKNTDAKIDDFGEELRGAAKHKWGQLAESFRAVQDIEDIKKQPLSKLFPQPNYARMHENGVETEALALLATLRSMIPAKPKSPYKVNAWAERVKGVRDIVHTFMGGHISVAEVKAHFLRGQSTLNAVAYTVDLLSQFKPEQMAEASRYTVRSGHYTYFDGKHYPAGKTFYSLGAPKGVETAVSAGSWSELLPKAKAFIEEQLKTESQKTAPKQAKLDIYTRRADNSVFIGYKGATGILPLKSGFKTSAEARAYLAENRAELNATLDKLRKLSREEQRKSTNVPRIGIERRQGNVTPEQFSAAFGFRGVQFGQYVDGHRRQSELNDAYEALMDMADLLNVQPKALSLNGALGLAFGARGRGGAKAHYEPGEVVINLTKGQGAGSLAHEWFHALDNYFGAYDVHGEASGKRSSEFMTERKRSRYAFSRGKKQEITHPVRQEVHDAFKHAVDTVTDSGMMVRATLLDAGQSRAYWTTKLEMSARAFERYLLDKAESKGISNDYLVNLRKANEHDNPETYAYPTDDELKGGIRQAFDHLFQTLKTKPTDKGITFYSRQGAEIGKGNVISDTGHSQNGMSPVKGMRQREAQGIANMWVRGMKGAARIQVKVVQTQAEAADMMPSGIPDEFGTVHALYQPEFSRVIVVADNIADGRQLRAKLRHEVLAHHGLASVIGDVEYDRILRVLHQTRGSKNKTIQSVWREVDRSYSNETPEMQANEFLAHMAERSELTGFGAMWDRFVSLLINGLKKAGILKPGDITPTEIRTILRTVAGRFKKTAMYDDEKPGTKEFDNTFSRTDALYSQERHDPFKPDSYDARQFATEVESIASMEQVPRHQIRLGDTPAVYQALGARNIELIMPASVVHKATDPAIREHAVRLEDVKKLPALLSDPLAVMRSATEHGALVSLITAQDVNGNPVITAIHLNVKGASFAEANKIASVYGKDNRVALQKQLDNDLLYIDKEKATKWLHAAGLQLPGANTVSGSNKNILSRLDVRNNKALYSRTTTPSMEAETNRKMGLHVEQGWIDKAKSFYDNVVSKDKTALKAWLSDTGRKLNTQTFDGLAPIKYAEDSAGISDARSSAYIGARMAAGAGSVITAALELGLPRYNKAEGIIEQQAGTHQSDALIGILDELGNHREHFFKWIAGHRSERLMKEGKENNFTADEIAYMKTLNRGHEPLFDRQKKKYDAFIQSMLDLQQDMGLIDPESRKQWEHAWYLPYFRETEGGEVMGPWNSKGIANQRSTVRRLKGSELTIKDPIENLFNYVAKSIDASMKNEAMRRAVINLADTDVVEVIESPNALDYQRLGKDAVKVFIDGQQQLVKVNDPALYRAFTMIDLQRSNALFMKAARQAKKVLTVCTTSMPDFIIRNFLRDSVHAWAINKDGFTPVVASWKSLRKALRTDTSLTEMMFAGATFGGGYSNAYDPVSAAKTIRGVLRRKGYSDSQIREFESSIVRNSKEVMGKIKQGLHQYQRLSEAAENANRLATYEAALKSGKSKAQAAFESRDLMDFSMMGSSTLMITLSDMLPFFNARMQGVSKLGRAFKNDPMGVLKRGGLITAASLGLMALNWDDERYEELPDWDKDIYWHAWIFGQHIRFPKPFELGLLLGTLPERFIRMLVGKDSGAKFGKLVAHNFMEAMAFNPIPQVVRPIAEAYVNYDFFKGGPIENLADSHLVAGARYNNQTSLLMREIGEVANLSPKMLDHLVMAYTGTLGSYVMGATNLLMRNIQDHGDTPTLRLDDMPVIKSFFRGSDPAKSTQFTEDFYRMMAEANQINSTINSFYKQGRGDDAGKLREKHQGKLLQRKGLTTTQKQVKALNAQIEMVRRDRILTADQKRERIDRLMTTRNKLVRQTVERVNPYFM